MAARNRKGLAENTRLRIKSSMLINRLEDHILGNIELSSSQMKAIEILLKKTVPDLSSVEMTAEITSNNARDITEAELLNIATSGSTGDTEAQESQDQVH